MQRFHEWQTVFAVSPRVGTSQARKLGLTVRSIIYLPNYKQTADLQNGTTHFQANVYTFFVNEFGVKRILQEIMLL